MLGILFKIVTAAFPFLREMLFGRSATGRTHMISFLIICNIALGISFFVTAKLTATLYISERKLKTEIIDLREKETKNAHSETMVIDVINTYSSLLSKSREEQQKLLLELNECKARTPLDTIGRH